MTLNSTGKAAEATLKIPFETAQNAEIAYRVLNVDKEPRRNFVQKSLSVEGDQLVVHFIADQVKNLRTAITSFFEALLLCQETIKEFGGPPASIEKIENAGTHTSANTA